MARNVIYVWTYTFIEMGYHVNWHLRYDHIAYEIKMSINEKHFTGFVRQLKYVINREFLFYILYILNGNTEINLHRLYGNSQIIALTNHYCAMHHSVCMTQPSSWHMTLMVYEHKSHSVILPWPSLTRIARPILSLLSIRIIVSYQRELYLFILNLTQSLHIL